MNKLGKILVLLALMLIGAWSAKAQGALSTGIAWRYTPAGAFPAGGATITICTANATGTPCSPTVTVYADAALSSPVSNPLSACTSSGQTGCADNLGNFSFYIASGSYSYTVTGQGLSPYGPVPLQVGISTGIPFRLQTIGNALVSGDFSFSGWGTGATISLISGSDSSFDFTMTAGTSPSIAPSVTLTFHDGPWTAISSVTSVMTGGSGSFADIQNTGSTNVTALTMNYMDLPVATKTYTVNVVVIGRSNLILSSSVINPVIQNPTGPQTITGFPLNLNGGLSVSGSAAIFNAGLTGTGNIGSLDLGSGALGSGHTWLNTQTFPNGSIGVGQLTPCGTNGQGPITSGGVMVCGSTAFNVTVNGGGTTSPLNLGNSPAAPAGYLNGVWQYGAGNASVALPISGTGGTVCSVTGGLTSGHLVKFDANGNCVDGGLQLQTSVSGCTTGSSSYDTCDVTVTWPNGGFADTNYFPDCWGVDSNLPPSGTSGGDAPTLNARSLSATQMVVVTQTQRGATAGYQTIYCRAYHP